MNRKSKFLAKIQKQNRRGKETLGTETEITFNFRNYANAATKATDFNFKLR